MRTPFSTPISLVSALVMSLIACTGTEDPGTGGNPVLTLPAAPTNLLATVTSSTQVTLTWNDNSGIEDGYRLERRETSGDNGSIGIIELASNVIEYVDTGLKLNTAYAYRVFAFNEVGNSEPSAEVSVTTQLPPTSAPNAPSNLVPQPASATQINLTWNDNSNTEDGFRIERKTSGSSFAEIAEVTAGVTTYSNTGLTAATQYTYRVRAFNSIGTSAYSNEATTVTNNAPSPGDTPNQLNPEHDGTLNWDGFIFSTDETSAYLNIAYRNSAPETRGYLRFDMDNVSLQFTSAILSMDLTGGSGIT